MHYLRSSFQLCKFTNLFHRMKPIIKKLIKWDCMHTTPVAVYVCSSTKSDLMDVNSSP